MANLRNTLFASSSMGSWQLSCFHFVSSEVFPQLGGCWTREAWFRLRSTRKTARDSYDLSPIWAHWGLGKWPSASMNLLHYMKPGGWSSSKGICWPRISDLCIVEFTAFSTLGHLFHFLHDWMMANDGLWWFVYYLTSFVDKPCG